MSYSDSRDMIRSDDRRDLRRHGRHGGGSGPGFGTIIGLVALALVIMNAKDLYRYLKISSM